MGAPTAYAVFRTLGDLLQALATCDESATAFPGEVLEVAHNGVARSRASRVAVPLARLGDEAAFRVLNGQYGWRAKVAAVAPPGKSVPLTELLRTTWRYRDPLRSAPTPGGTAGWPDDGEALEGIGAPAEYVLGVRPERAASVLRALTDVLATGVRAVALVTPHDDRLPFSFFWLVTMDAPCLTALDAADRAWWGPLGDGRPRIYEQWRHELSVPVPYLRRIPFGPQAEIVLLSPDEPHVVVLRAPGGGRTFADLVDVAEFRAGRAEVVDATVDGATEAPTRFTVNLRLVPEDARRTVARRADQLEDEIAAKQSILERMRLQVDEDVFEPTEPLYLYSAGPGQVPSPLRLLLLEWSDQDEDLGALRYQRVQAGRTGPFGRAELHVVTTARAVSGEGPLDLGVRLREYPPGLGRYDSFELLPVWPRLGLRLFAPARQHLTLYPDLPPSRLAADRLAGALLPGPATEWAALLLPGDSLVPVPIRLDRFRPLVEAFGWDCALDASPAAGVLAEAARSAGAEATEQVLATVRRSLVGAVEHERDARLAREREAIMLALAGERSRLDRHVADLPALAAEVEEVAALVGTLSSLTAQLAKLDARVLRDATGARDRARELTGITTELGDVMGKLSKQAAVLAAIERRLPVLHDE